MARTDNALLSKIRNMPLFFIVNDLDNEYDWLDFTMTDSAYEYAYDIHNIPEEYIEEIEIYTQSKRVEITLFENKCLISQDWYQMLLKFAA